VSDALLASVDQLVADGVAGSRSDAVRQGLEALAERHRRARVGAAIAAAYRRHPQTVDELAWADEATVRMIADEPW